MATYDPEGFPPTIIIHTFLNNKRERTIFWCTHSPHFIFYFFLELTGLKMEIFCSAYFSIIRFFKPSSLALEMHIPWNMGISYGLQ